MIHLIGLLLVAPLIGGIMFIVLKKSISWKEFLLMEVVAILIVTGGFFLARYGAMSDTEHWNGRITQKIHDSEHCCHCRQVCDTCTRNVCSGSGKDRSCRDESYDCNCREVCDHSQDYYWAVKVSTGDSVMIDDCEPNRHRVPAAWTNAYIGEPASVAKSYTNYLLADKNSLMRHETDNAYLEKVPPFPSIHGHYKSNKVLALGVSVPPEWEKGMREINAHFGHAKQVDITLVVTRGYQPEFAEALEAKWLYGPKNSVTIIMDAPDGNTIKWARVVTISRVAALKIAIRDEMPGMTLDNPKEGLALISKLVLTKFKRTPMAEWEYLASAAKPATWALILLYLLTLAATIGIGIWAHKKDIFGDEGSSPSNRFKRRRY